MSEKHVAALRQAKEKLTHTWFVCLGLPDDHISDEIRNKLIWPSIAPYDTVNEWLRSNKYITLRAAGDKVTLDYKRRWCDQMIEIVKYWP